MLSDDVLEGLLIRGMLGGSGKNPSAYVHALREDIGIKVCQQ